MKLVLLITAKIEDGFTVAQSWREAGAPGVTVIQGHGIHSLHQEVKSGKVELEPMVYSIAKAMASLLEQKDGNILVFLSIVPEGLVDEIIKVTTDILGDLTKPDTGVIAVVDLERAIGVYQHGET